MTDNICTPQELRNLADNSELTINTLSKFIQEKTNQEYLIIQRQLIKDLDKQFFENRLHIFGISELWVALIKENQYVLDKWKDVLKECNK